jgi:hypothetical protein
VRRFTHTVTLYRLQGYTSRTSSISAKWTEQSITLTGAGATLANVAYLKQSSLSSSAWSPGDKTERSLANGSSCPYRNSTRLSLGIEHRALSDDCNLKVASAV